jgi:hypothetical protein
MKRTLIARGNGLDEPDPFLVRYERFRVVGIEQIAQGPAWAIMRILM